MTEDLYNTLVNLATSEDAAFALYWKDSGGEWKCGQGDAAELIEGLSEVVHYLAESIIDGTIS